MEMQVRTLSYLRAVDLSAVHQTNRYFWQNTALQHAIVLYCAEQVYPPHLTEGFAVQPTTTTTTASSARVVLQEYDDDIEEEEEDNEKEEDTMCDDATATATARAPTLLLYSFEHLRNLELLVVVRLLNSPEPTTGFVVSKSWCKTALRWLEDQQERMLLQQQQRKNRSQRETNNNSNNNSNRKKKTKKQRLKERKQVHSNRCHTISSSSCHTISSSSHSIRSSVIAAAAALPPPPANVNSDITCEHDQLQHYTSLRSARARRRLLDKQAWKILKALYPESTPLPASGGECLQCRAEACLAQKQCADQQDAARQQRKGPLQQAAVRRFYTRTRGVPEHCLLLRKNQTVQSSTILRPASAAEIAVLPTDQNDDCDRKIAAREDFDDVPFSLSGAKTDADHHSATLSMQNNVCPFVDGTYYVLPRSWCHGWRRFIKTGEGGLSPTKYAPPDATCLLCDSHRMALLPPHLEAFLSGESSQLLEAAGTWQSSAAAASNSNVTTFPALPPGQAPTDALVAMRALGLSEMEISQQLTAMRSIETQRLRQQRQARKTPSTIGFEIKNAHVVPTPF